MHTSHKKHTKSDLFNVCKNHVMDKNLKLDLQFDSDTSVTLTQRQGHPTRNELVGPKLGYNNAQFEKTRLNSVCNRANDNVFFCPIRKHVDYIP